MSPHPSDSAPADGQASLFLRALVLGALAGCLEVFLVLETGIVRPAALAINFAVLVATFGSVASGWVIASKWSLLRRIDADRALLATSVCIFALRGCLLECGPSWILRVVTPLGILVATWGLMSGLRWRMPDRAPGWSIVVSTLAMTLSAIEFATRDGLTGGSAIPLLAFLGMTALAIVSGLAIQRGRGVSIAWLLLLGAGSMSWAVYRAPPLWIEPAAGSRDPRSAQEAGFPNVIIVVMDTVRADHLSLYGYGRQTSPNLDALAPESLVFDHAIASGNYSLPSHASLFTGLLPSQHGARKRVQDGASSTSPSDSALADGVETLASRLQRRRFTTGGLSANYVYLARWTGLQQGFDVFDDRPHTLMAYHPFDFPLQRRWEMLRGLVGSAVDPSRSRREWEGRAVTDAARHFATNVRTPFLLLLNYFDAHDPHRSREGHSFRGDGLANDRGALPVYDSEVAYVDAEVGRLIASLRTAGVLDRTILVVVADHGEFFGEHGFSQHRVGAYEEVLHVPLLVRYPKALAPGRVERAFGLHEVQRLILDLLESRPTDWLSEGSDQSKVLAQIWGRVSASDTVPQELVTEPDANIVYKGSLKLIERRSGMSEMYDLAADPREANNLLIEPSAEVLALHSLMRQAVANLAPARRGREPDATAADLEALRGLGYLSLQKPTGK